MKKLLSVLFITLSLISYSHSGRTDASGGHKDNKNRSGLGYYHYHHGYSAHLHPNGVCPYDTPKAIKKPLQQTKTNTAKTIAAKKKLMSEDEIYTRLLWLGYSGKNAIKNFQKDNGLTPDGIAGTKTINLLKQKTI